MLFIAFLSLVEKRNKRRPTHILYAALSLSAAIKCSFIHPFVWEEGEVIAGLHQISVQERHIWYSFLMRTFLL